MGLTTEESDLGWVARVHLAGHRCHPAGGTNDATAPLDAVISVKVDDVEAAYADARARGYEIVHPLSTEEWGVHRFFVRAPDGNVLNIVQDHRARD